MDSKILASLKFDPGILIIAMLILIVVMFILLFMLNRKQERLNRKYKAFMRGGRNAKSLDESIQNRLDEIEGLKESSDLLNQRMLRLEKCMGRSFQRIGIVKYDAFKEMGGKLSFAYAMLNDSNDGFVINSIHSKDGCYSYIKEIIKGESYIPLGEEETEALEMAKQSAIVNE